MKKDEILEFLKDNLRIELHLDEDGDLITQLVLDGEVISKDWILLPLNNS